MTLAARVGIVGVVLLVVSGTSCAEDPREQPATLPPVTSSAGGASTSSSVTPSAADDAVEEKAIRAVYRDFLANRNGVIRLSPAQARRAVAQWLTDPELSKALDTLEEARANHLSNRGLIKSDIMMITIDGDTARLEDCMDKNATYLVDSRTGRKIAGSTGDSDIWAVSDFKKTADGWRISATSSKHESCVDR